MQTPSIGRIVGAFADPKKNNGSDVCPAVITRVWSSSTVAGDDAWCVNLRLLYDTPYDVGSATSVWLFEDEQTARENDAVRLSPCSAFWLERV